jgi:hypothetical protein
MAASASGYALAGAENPWPAPAKKCGGRFSFGIARPFG